MRRGAVRIVVALLTAICSIAENNPANERSFSVPPSVLQTALKKLPGGTSGPLPVLEGFVEPGARALNRYQRPYFECSVHVSSTTSGGSLVRVNAKITAWNQAEYSSVASR